ncbi:MAG: DeoR/GlpR transcriptional regulator [Naasia sp.]|jgi:DeoR/GlpR family transcriptional regulator of sugar metabolism|uniref:DeoR/GlpR family DNA-binding transcription regulator n=1 Tax=Naasia sp. TaxID=2546198 RepID=UPI0026321C79|nr:DeoR/GlpR family DNA-binding transcription regulator [Naasia sp.]MCU1569947.1 DeoR/GlpR transcriptional regulator [Naasia sp.]
MVRATSPLSVAARRDLVVRIVGERGHMVIAELAVELGVSEMTVRRDVVELASQGRVISYYGGVRAPQLQTVPGPYGRRLTEEPLAKVRIARRAAELVPDGAVIAVDAGSTAAKLAQQLTDRSRLRVVTASVPVIDAFMGGGTVEVVALGGTLRREMQSFCGPGAVAAARELQVETYFLGASALSERGVFDITDLDTALKRELIAVSGRVVALADSTKFRRRAMSRTCGWQSVDVLVTDDRIDSEWLAVLQDENVEVMLVPSGEPA